MSDCSSRQLQGEIEESFLDLEGKVILSIFLSIFCQIKNKLIESFIVSLQPECRVNDDMRFTANNQYIHKMMRRWGPNVRTLHAIKKCLAKQNIELNSNPLVSSVLLLFFLVIIVLSPYYFLVFSSFDFPSVE